MDRYTACVRDACKKKIVIAAGGIAAAFLLLNVAAYRHARAMTRFVPGVRRTASPEKLSKLQKVAVLLSGVRLSRPENGATPKDLGLAYETVNFPGAGGLSAEAWWIRAKNRAGLVILFHGYADSKSALVKTAREFNRFGYDAMLVDFNGSGGSAGKDTSLGFHEAEVVASAVRWAAKEIPDQKPVLYGVSMGAAAVLRAVGTGAVEPRAVIVESPFDRMLSAVRHRFERMGVPWFPSAHLLLFWGGVQRGFNGFDHNPVDYARTVRCPTLLLFGDQDVYISLTETESIFANLSGEKTLKVFAGAGHEHFAVARPKEWRETVRGFLSPRLIIPAGQVGVRLPLR